jgi:hypothetical protein
LLDQPFRIPAGELSPEQWAIDTDKRIGEIFFGMDSAIERFVFALNAVGYLKSPSKFCDITTASGLKRIRPVVIRTTRTRLPATQKFFRESWHTPVTFKSPCQCHHNHGEHRWSVKNDPSLPPTDASAIRAVTRSDIYSRPGPMYL